MDKKINKNMECYMKYKFSDKNKNNAKFLNKRLSQIGIMV